MSEQQNMKDRIIKKAWEDANFRQELLCNPKAALQKELEIVIPDDIEIKVVEETPKSFYLVLPVNPSEITSSLDSSEDFEAQSVY